MADRVLEGKLAETLANLYTETGAWEEVARRLLLDHDLRISGQTLRRWAKELEAA